jgi:hypothetical protein
MENLNTFGKNHLSVYLKDYALGVITFKEARAYITCCFNDIKGMK